jgi:hypothetical protein
MDPLDGRQRPSRPEEIHIFCPVRFYLGRQVFDGLLDTLDARGGTFFVLTEENPAALGSEQRLTLQRERKGELVIPHGAASLRIPCRVRGIRFDEDGLYMYVGVNFLLDHEGDRRRLNDLVRTLW